MYDVFEEAYLNKKNELSMGLHYEPKSNRQSMKLKHADSPVKKKF